MHLRLMTLAVMGLLLVAAPPASGAAPSRHEALPGDGRARGRPGWVLGLYVQRDRLHARGRRFVAAYQRCLGRRGDRCYARIRRRCVQPEFLGRCRTHDRFFQRRLRGYRCIERRVGRDPGPLRRERQLLARAPPHRPQLHALHRAGRSRSAPSASCGRRGPTRGCARSRSRATSSCARAASATRSASRRARSRSTAAATRCARAASRSGCCARTAPGSSS